MTWLTWLLVVAGVVTSVKLYVFVFGWKRPHWRDDT